jgi:hypothetical protein
VHETPPSLNDTFPITVTFIIRYINKQMNENPSFSASADYFRPEVPGDSLVDLTKSDDAATSGLVVDTAPSVDKKSEDDLQALIEKQQQIQQWLSLVNNKIFEMETVYLDECASGNVIRGWDVDGRLPLHRSRNIDEKDRLFSFSSYSYLLEKRAPVDPVVETKPVSSISQKAPILKSKKQQKKRKIDFDDWNGTEDY